MSPSPVKATDAVPSEIEVTSPVVWEAFVYDENGFVISDHEDFGLTEFEAQR